MKLITIQNKFLIAWAWGPRRVTSKKRYGSVSSAYPSEITAAASLWITWFKIGTIQWIKRQTQVVIPSKPASKKARTQAAMGHAKEPVVDVPQVDIDALQAMRQELRKQRRFEEADKIRDQIIAAGGEVKDSRI